MADINQTFLDLQEKIRNHTTIFGVVGLGYVGLPFAVEKAKVSFTVLRSEQSLLGTTNAQKSHGE